MDPVVSRVILEFSAPWFWIPHCQFGLELLDYSEIIKSDFSIIFASWCLNVRSWGLSTMIFGFPIVDLAMGYLDIRKLSSAILKTIFASWRLKGRSWILCNIYFWIHLCLFGLKLLGYSGITKSEFFNHFCILVSQG